jgi:hypothetical protein
MPELARKKITFEEMRAAGVRGLLIYCSDYKCGHSTTISTQAVVLSDVEPHRGQTISTLPSSNKLRGIARSPPLVRYPARNVIKAN